MDTRKLAARKEKQLMKDLGKWSELINLRPGERVGISGQITPQKVELKVKFFQKNTISPVVDKKVSKKTLAKIGGMTDFNEGQQRIVNILVSSQNQPTTRRALVERGCEIPHIDQINCILRKREIPVAIRMPWIHKGQHWTGPLCFRHVDRSVRD